jgi:hypothetical protein
MPNDYLAMYLKVNFGSGKPDAVVAIRHFSANKSRLSDAIKSGNLFTDFEQVKKEASQVRAQKNITVLLDSSLPGRNNILPQEGKDGVNLIISEIGNLLNPSQPNPAIGGPIISSLKLWSGMRNMSLPRPYKVGFNDTIFKPNYLSMHTIGIVRFSPVVPVVFEANLYMAVSFSGWDDMFTVIM